jgi:hypothetical protein
MRLQRQPSYTSHVETLPSRRLETEATPVPRQDLSVVRALGKLDGLLHLIQAADPSASAPPPLPSALASPMSLGQVSTVPAGGERAPDGASPPLRTSVRVPGLEGPFPASSSSGLEQSSASPGGGSLSAHPSPFATPCAASIRLGDLAVTPFPPGGWGVVVPL